MKKKFILSSVLVCLAFFSITKTTNAENPPAQSFKAGGININIPEPDASFIEISNDYRGLVELFVPQSNRLLCAYALKNEIPDLLKDGSDKCMSQYALVEVPRRGEYIDCEASDFNEVVSTMKKAFGESSLVMKEGEKEFNSRMVALDLSSMKVKLGQPTLLGNFFSKPDVNASGMLMGVEMNGKIWKMGVAIILLRIKKRLLFVYLYAEYKNNESIMWLRETSEKWCNEIISANN